MLLPHSNKSDFVIENKPLSMNDAFYSSKSNKGTGYDVISYNVMKTCFESLCEPSKSLFNFSIEKCVFPGDLNIARITPIYKGDDSSDVSNYRPISVLPCFSIILERIMYNCVYKYLIKNDILYSK